MNPFFKKKIEDTKNIYLRTRSFCSFTGSSENGFSCWKMYFFSEFAIPRMSFGVAFFVSPNFWFKSLTLQPPQTLKFLGINRSCLKKLKNVPFESCFAFFLQLPQIWQARKIGCWTFTNTLQGLSIFWWSKCFLICFSKSPCVLLTDNWKYTHYFTWTFF